MFKQHVNTIIISTWILFIWQWLQTDMLRCIIWPMGHCLATHPTGWSSLLALQDTRTLHTTWWCTVTEQLNNIFARILVLVVLMPQSVNWCTLTLTAAITTAADHKFCNIFPNFRKNKVWNFMRIVCLHSISSSWQQRLIRLGRCSGSSDIFLKSVFSIHYGALG